MNATEAKKRRRASGATTLAERVRRDPERASRIDHYRRLISIEEQVVAAMAERHVTAAQLARRLDRPASTIARDLKGGLSEAKLGRLRRYAEALGYELVVRLEPRDDDGGAVRYEHVVRNRARGASYGDRISAKTKRAIV